MPTKTTKAAVALLYTYEVKLADPSQKQLAQSLYKKWRKASKLLLGVPGKVKCSDTFLTLRLRELIANA